MEAVIFDLGNVLLLLDWDRPARAIAARTGKTRQQLDDYFQRSPWPKELAIGAISKNDFVEAIAADLAFQGRPADLAQYWSDMFTPNAPMITLAKALQRRMPTLILSNTNALHMRFIFANYPDLHGLDGYILSHEIGVEKPDARIYEHALTRFNLRPERTVFIDDLPENIEGARRVGLHGIHFQNTDQACAELTKLGVSAT